MNIKDNLTGLVQQTPRWPLTPCCGDLRSTSDRPRCDPTVRKWWHCCRGMTWLPFVWSTFERVRLLCSRRPIGPRRAHIRWRPAFKMAAAGMIGRASRLRLNVAALSISYKCCHLNQSKSDTQSNRHVVFCICIQHLLQKGFLCWIWFQCWFLNGQKERWQTEPWTLLFDYSTEKYYS